VVIRVWPQDNSFGRGVRCELMGVQFAKDGDAFGEASPDLTGMFKPITREDTPAWL
jgi:hypothetical protein